MTVDQARRRRALARWHRRLALLVAAWLVLLAASGLLINHAHDWGLDRAPLAAQAQLWIYGIDRDDEDFCRTAAAVGPECAEVFGRLALPGGILLLAENSLYFLDEAGQLVERLSPGYFGLSMLQAGLYMDSTILLSDAARTIRTDAELMDWTVLGPEQTAALNGQAWQTRGAATTDITWERFLLDLHAARFLGPLAKGFTDLMAALILVLAVSGFWLFRTTRNGNGNGKGR